MRRALTVFLVAGVLAATCVGLVRLGSRGEGEGPDAGTVAARTPEQCNRQAEKHVTRALELLDEEAQEAGERLRAFRAELREAEGLLVRSLTLRPAQPEALGQLAAVRWELQPPRSREERDRLAEMIRVAGDLAPTVARVQRRLGRLLMRMGLEDEGLERLGRAMTLSPAMTGDLALELRTAGVAVDRIRAAVPPDPEALAGLWPLCDSAGDFSALADLLEPHLRGAVDREVVRRYGEARIAAGEPGRLLEKLNESGPLDDPLAEQERLLQLARGELGRGRPEEALAAARRAPAAAPWNPRGEEGLAEMLLAVGEAEEALERLRRAVPIQARLSTAVEPRARLYRKIGEAEEALRRPHRALEAYRRALDLVPGDPIARVRLEALEQRARKGR